MSKNVTTRLILSILFAICFSTTLYADTYPKREMRSVWLATVWCLDWPRSGPNNSDLIQGTTQAKMNSQKTQLENLISNLKAAGFNSVNFQIRSNCDAMYNSSYEPWCQYLTGTRGTAPYNNWDPLAYCVELCHQYGMECHAWVNPFRFSTSSSTSSSYPSTTQDKAMINKGWILEYNSVSVLNPGIAEVRDYIVNKVCKEIVTNYDIDGLVFDDYFYPNGTPLNTEGYDYDLYQESGTTMSHADWRRDNVNRTMKAVYDMVQSLKPEIKFGIAPAGVAETGAKAHGIEPAGIKSSGYQYNGIFADPVGWILGGYIDYISPQLYWSTTNESSPFKPLCKWWNALAKEYNVGCYISHDIAGSVNAWNNSEEDYAERNIQVSYNRETAVDNNPGSIFYSASYISGPRTSGLGDNLKEKFYQYRALTPKVVKDGEIAQLVNPGKVTNLKRSSSTLSWTAISGFYNMRYAVYAIPLTVGRVDAASDIHTSDGGFKAEYLIDVTYGNTMSGVPTGNYWYAVTAVDCYGNEWAAATINEPVLGNATITLNTPADNSTLTFTDNSFSWTSDGESFLFQISSSSDFSTMIFEQETTGKSITVALDGLTDGTTYYWRVHTSKSGYNSVWSETRAFTMETRPSINLSLVSPVASATIDAESETFTWNGVEGATYTFEIAEASTFASPIIKLTTTNTSYTLDATRLASNKSYYWRVSATKDGYIPATSSTRKFTTPKMQNASVDGITIEKMWVQSINDGNFPSQLSSTNCKSPRSITVYEGNIYILERTSDTECSLLMFNGETGAYVKTIALTGDIYTYSGGTIEGWAYKPGNSIFTDNAGNLCISCLNVTTESKPLTVCTVKIDPDKNTATTTRVFESALTSIRHRIDYANASGDITTTGGQIWAATNDSTVIRWSRTSQGTWNMEQTTIKNFYPKNITILGTAPAIQPISSTQFIVDGASNHPTLYTFNSGGYATLNGSFEDNPTLQPVNATHNGTYSITIGNTPLFIYVDDNNQSNGHSFSIVANKGNFDFSQFQFMQSVPENKLGKTNHTWALDQPVAINNADGSVTIFLYAPLNGLAAYRLRLPVLDTPTLVSPKSGATAASDVQKFTWTGEGSTYLFQISANASFTAIVGEETVSGTSFSAPVNSLTPSTTYYWRVTGKKDGYTDSEPSEAWSFVTAEAPTWPKPTLGYPANDAEITGDTPFTATKTSGEQYIEIATDANFNNIYLNLTCVRIENITNNDGETVEWYEYTVPISQLANGTYYWRSRAVSTDASLDDGISAVYSFTVSGSFEAPQNYTMKRENHIYDNKVINNNYVSLSNNWIRSTTYENGLSQTTSGKFARGFCVRPDINGDQNGLDIIYMPSDDTTSPQRLDRYNAATGERLDELTINGSLATDTYPNIGCFLDDALNICVYNLIASAGTLQICQIDPVSGKATEVFTTTTPGRVDHCRTVGDVTSGNFFVFAAVSASKNVYRWSIDLGNVSEPESMEISTLYPTGASNLGGNIMVFPVDDTYFYTDGAYTDFTLYSFGDSAPTGTFADATAAAATKHVSNGGAFFTHNGQPFIIYPCQGDASNEYRYNITSVSSHTGSYSGASVKWTIPAEEEAIPGWDAGAYAYTALADYLPKGGKQSRASDPNSTTLFLYVPGSGLASYTLTNYIYTGTDEPIDMAVHPQVTVADGKVKFGTTITGATLYSVSGQVIALTADATEMDAPTTKGIYLLQLDIDGAVTIHKLIIK